MAAMRHGMMVGVLGIVLGFGCSAARGEDGSAGEGSQPNGAPVTQTGSTKRSERTITGALIWLANHQSADGSWSLTDYTRRCTDKTCEGKGQLNADSAATALGLLPFLGAGQTHKTKGPYQKTIQSGLHWLIQHQKPGGDLRAGHNMYSHGLATFALCSAYGVTGDKDVGAAAQRAVDFILVAQNKGTGGWRYAPGDQGDTCVLGWQFTALRSAKLAGLNVPDTAFDGAGKWLDSCNIGPGNSRYSYVPGSPPTPTMTAVGLFCRLHLGMSPDHATMVEGRKYILGRLPDPKMPNLYYWYYATQALHVTAGEEWDTWHRALRRRLIETQRREPGCAMWSWDPGNDPWGRHGGRLMMTSLTCLTLEVYYQFLPIWKGAATLKAAEAKPAPAPEGPLQGER